MKISFCTVSNDPKAFKVKDTGLLIKDSYEDIFVYSFWIIILMIIIVSVMIIIVSVMMIIIRLMIIIVSESLMIVTGA